MRSLRSRAVPCGGGGGGGGGGGIPLSINAALRKCSGSRGGTRCGAATACGLAVARGRGGGAAIACGLAVAALAAWSVAVVAIEPRGLARRDGSFFGCTQLTKPFLVMPLCFQRPPCLSLTTSPSA